MNEIHDSAQVTLDVSADSDPAARRFSYRTVNTDGNPSYALWSWEVRPAGDGCEVRVRWDIYLKTVDRRFLAGPIRRRDLRHEVTASLRQLAHAARASARGSEPPTCAGWPRYPG